MLISIVVHVYLELERQSGYKTAVPWSSWAWQIGIGARMRYRLTLSISHTHGNLSHHHKTLSTRVERVETSRERLRFQAGECWWLCRQRPYAVACVCSRSSIIHWPQLAASWSLYICLHRHSDCSRQMPLLLVESWVSFYWHSLQQQTAQWIRRWWLHGVQYQFIFSFKKGIHIYFICIPCTHNY